MFYLTPLGQMGNIQTIFHFTRDNVRYVRHSHWYLASVSGCDMIICVTYPNNCFVWQLLQRRKKGSKTLLFKSYRKYWILMHPYDQGELHGLVYKVLVTKFLITFSNGFFLSFFTIKLLSFLTIANILTHPVFSSKTINFFLWDKSNNNNGSENSYMKVN